MPRFPLDIAVPSFDATGGMRQFGAYRNPKRLHAGCDLYAPRGTPVRAIADGVFQQRKYFDLGTDEVLIHHPGIGLVRYLEMMQAKHYAAERTWLERENGGRAPTRAPEFAEGKVTEGDLIGHVGELVGLGGFKPRMLHFELYDESAVGENLRGYAGKGAYSRHPALLDPTEMLEALREGRIAAGLKPSGKVTNRGSRPKGRAAVDSRTGPITFPDKRKPRRDEQVFARLTPNEPCTSQPSTSWDDVATLYRSTWRT